MFDPPTHFPCVAARPAFFSAAAVAALLARWPLPLPVSPFPVLGEGLGLGGGQGGRLRALVEWRGGARGGLQKPPDGRVVQHCGVTLGGVLQQQEQQT